MANVYWVDSSSIASWDDGPVGVSTPWGSASALQDNVAAPTNGDVAVFNDLSSTTKPLAGPGAAVNLGGFDSENSSQVLSGIFNNITISNGNATFAQTTQFDGVVGANCTCIFRDLSEFSSSAPVGANSIFEFQSSSFSSATGYVSTNTINLYGSAAINGVISAGALVVKAAASAVVNSNCTFTSILIEATGILTGVGNLIGPITITGRNDLSGQITGNATITVGGTNTGLIVGNVTVAVGAVNAGPVTGNVTLLSSSSSNTGIISGTLTAPYSTGPGAYGTFNALTLTGLPAGGVRRPSGIQM